MEKLNVASFFAGIGGFDIGFEKANFNLVFNCENNSFCRSVLNARWPKIKAFDDISLLSANSIPDADIWCAGFPCQDLSVARGSNERDGLNGSRSGLLFKLFDLITETKPKVILLENVQGLLNSNNGKDFAVLLNRLDKLNYAVSWRLLNSRYFGLPQSRPRVYICAWLENPLSAGNTLFENRYPIQQKNERQAFLETSWKEGNGPIVPKVAFCLAATSGRHTGTDWSRTYVAYVDGVRRLTPLECERLQGFPDGWTRINDLNIEQEKADSLRYHAIGNAVSVNVIEWIANRIYKQFKVSKEPEHNFDHNENILLKSLDKWPGLNKPKLIGQQISFLLESDEKIKWPNAGIVWNNQVIASNTPPSLHENIQSDLINIIEQSKPDIRYFLSPNAAEGILRRVDSQNRHLFIPLRIALEKLSGRIEKSITKTHLSHQQIDFYSEDTECVLP